MAVSPENTEAPVVVIRTDAASEPTPTYTTSISVGTGAASADVLAVAVIGPPTNAVSLAGVMKWSISEKVSSSDDTITRSSSINESASGSI